MYSVEQRAIEAIDRANGHGVPIVWTPVKPLPENLKPVHKFNSRLLPDSLRPWVEDAAERMQAPIEFIAVSAMVSAGSLVGDRLRIRPQRETDWEEAGNLWGALIQRPGLMKSPAMDEGTQFIRRAEAKVCQDNDAAKASHAAELEKFKFEKTLSVSKAKKADSATGLKTDSDAPEPPAMRRHIVCDATVEALQYVCKDNAGGILVLNDEISGLLRKLDRDDYAADRAFYLTAWSGKSNYTYDRIGRGHVNAHVNISLLGGAQPSRIADYVRAAVKGTAGDDGFLQRFGMVVWPDEPTQWISVDRAPNTEYRTWAEAAFEKLRVLDPIAVGAVSDPFKPEDPPYLRFAPEGQEIFAKYLLELMQEITKGGLSDALTAHLSKFKKLFPSLALVLHLLDGGTGPVSGKATARALGWVKFLRSHAERLYASGTIAETDAARKILKKIKSNDLPGPFKARDIYRAGWSELDKDATYAGLSLLVDNGYVAEQHDDNTGGRPAVTYIINPEVLRCTTG
jgi:putative DNA primase/helicase